MSFRHLSFRSAFAAACVLLAMGQNVGAQLADGTGNNAGRGQGRAMVQACSADFRTHCAGTRPGGGRLVQCLRDHSSALSDGCRTAMTAMQSRAAGTLILPAETKVERNLAYGSEPEQRMDVYLSKGLSQNAGKAPIIVMVHGGGWSRGSKSSRGVVENKVGHWLPKGFIFVSVGNRLLPKADPLSQAADVAAALASVQQKAASWGGDPAKIVLMGHSAGAHLAALVSVDSSIAAKAGLKPWAGTVALDSAAYDIAPIMKQLRHPKLYDEAFGKDPDFWVKASPTRQVKDSVPQMLLVCSSLRRLSCRQADAFALKAGAKAKVLPIALRHMPINTELGKDSDYTRQVDAFLASIGLTGAAQ